MQGNKNDRTIKLVDLTSVKYNILAACKIKIENFSTSIGKKLICSSDSVWSVWLENLSAVEFKQFLIDFSTLKIKKKQLRLRKIQKFLKKIENSTQNFDHIEAELPVAAFSTGNDVCLRSLGDF